VILFLIGSALCGQANGMTELIAFRAVQGLGPGGLIVLTQAVIGDVVSPRRAAGTRVFSAPSSVLPAWPDRCSDLLRRLARELIGDRP
jgi:MFS family permease